MYIERINSLIKEKGITTNKLLTSCGLSPGTINNWKTGKSTPTSAVLAKIADYFGVSVDYIMGREQPKERTIATGMSIARGGEIKHYTLSEERLKYLQDLAEMLEKDERRNKK